MPREGVPEETKAIDDDGSIRELRSLRDEEDGIRISKDVKRLLVSELLFRVTSE